MSHNKKLEEQMILRLPPQLADQVRKMLRTKQLTEEIEFEFDEDQRNAKFRVGRKKYDAYLVDLPCIVESHKTLDKTTYYKSADIGQMLVVQDPKEPQPPPPEFSSLNGVTPATRDIRRRKWRKPPDAAQLKEIENEVNRLLKPADNESIEILNADDYEELDELNGVVEKIEPPKQETKIKFKMPEREDAGPATPAAAGGEAKEKKKKERRKKKEKEGGEGEGAAEGGEGKEKVKKERRRRKKKEEGTPGSEGQAEGATTEKKKPARKRSEKKPKSKGAVGEPALPTSPSLSSAPATPTSAPAFPFTNTITPLPPPLPQPMSIPHVFQQTHITTKIATPAFNSNPFANAPSSAFANPITTTPIVTQPLVPLVPASPTLSSTPAQGHQQLVAQQRRLHQEVDQLKLKVTDATNKYNILPNAILKQRQQAKLAEVTEQYDKKVKELEAVEKQLKEAQR
eukprot:Phypoly_transcript_08328.p1 GENE.Phypoly_transcript_08328~~Phypoly_transcript_08328.p1  ORF type:complete len:456 (+),score=143.08 Phypoly_transcript_08328:100-1467(+)